MTTTSINFKREQLKQSWLNAVDLLLHGFRNDYNEGTFVVNFRGCENLTTNVICDLLEEKKNIINDNFHLLPDFYTIELNALSKRV